MPAFKYLITGRVQGVGYRSFVARLAKQYGIKGFVRNMPGGEVEVIAQAPEADALMEFEKELENYSSNGAYVEAVEKEAIEEGDFEDFSIRF
ncbi:MAG: acylphosphatase [Candidatus Micrarchaeia archaeon]|jgi:acylphosphatase